MKFLKDFKKRAQSYYAYAAIFAALLLATDPSLALAQTSQMGQPSKAQLEQLRNLTPTQRKAMAERYGIDLESLQQGMSTTQDSEQTVDNESLLPRERMTSEDEEKEEDEDKREKDGEKELEVYGLNIFSGEPTTFAPLVNAPVPSDYTVGPGDSILLQLYGKESGEFRLSVSREGTISIPNIGPLTVNGLSYSEMKSLIKEQVSSRMIGVQAAVSMGELRSMQVFVMGEAYKPGAYTVSALTTISQALLVSGGVSDIASLRNIALKRRGKTVTNFDLYDLLIYGDSSNDRLLQPGDVVFVPSRGPTVAVKGEVLRPALYEVKDNETIKDVIEFAGGPTPKAYLKSIRLARVSESRRELKTISGLETGAATVDAQQGDEITVPEVAKVIDNSVELKGAVARVGSYEWYKGIELNDLVKSVSQDLLADTDLNYGLILREDPSSRVLTAHQFNPGEVITNVDAQAVKLKPRDQVYFFSRFQYSDNRVQAGFEQREDFEEKQLELFDQLLQEEKEKGIKLKDSQLTLNDVRVPAENSRIELLKVIRAQLDAQGPATTNSYSVEVVGEVRYPDVYPMVENASVRQFISAAGGLRESAFIERAELTRTVIRNQEAVTINKDLSLASIVSGQGDVSVKARDRINILRIPEWADLIEVEIEGEVRFPGKYAVSRGDTLRDLIKRAGGLTQKAFIEGAVFTREEIKEIERQRIESLSERLRQELASQTITGNGANIDYAQLSQLLDDLENAQAVGRLVIDLPAVISGESGYGVELMDGDLLAVPSQRHMVSIVGEVQMPTTYRYEDALSIWDYISRSGGVKKRADSEGIYVIRANGLIETMKSHDNWFSSTQVAIQPGDTIVVPLDTSYKETMDLWVSGTQIVYQMAVALAALSNI